MDVAEAIDAEAITVQHRTIVEGFDQTTGKRAKTPSAPVDIQAAVQPASGRQLMDVPEGLRTEARFIAWSRTTINENDQIQYDGKWWRVVYRWPRPQDGFNRVAIGMLK